MKGYISAVELMRVYLVSKNVIYRGVNRNGGKINKSWQHVKIDGSLYILVSSIPKGTITKHGIPTEKETSYERLIRECLTEAVEGANTHINMFLEAVKHDLNTAKTLAAFYAVMCEVVDLTGGELKARRGTLKPVFEQYMKMRYRYQLRHFSYYTYFSAFATKFRTALMKGENEAAAVVLGGKYGNLNAKKTTDYHHALFLIYASHGKGFSCRVIAIMMNYYLKTGGFNLISESWVKLEMRDPETRLMVDYTRKGKKKFYEQYMDYLPRKKPLYPANLWAVDGTPLQFHYTENGRMKRLYFVAAVDVCTLKIVGWSHGQKGEDRYLILNSLKMAVSLEGHLPREILSDNFGASKTDEIKDFKRVAEKCGTSWRHIRVGNSGDNGHAERALGTFEKTVQALYDGYFAAPGNKRDQPSPDYQSKVYKNGLPSYEQLITRLAEMVQMYNEQELGDKATPNFAYRTFPKPNAVKVDQLDTVTMFWKKRIVKVSRGMVCFEIRKMPYRFEVYDHDLKMKINKTEVAVRYDESDMSSIMIFDAKTDEFLAELRPKKTVGVGIADRKEGDEKVYIKHRARQKSFEKKIEKKRGEIISKGLEMGGIEAEQLEQPNEYLAKKAVRSRENEQMREYLNQHNILPGVVGKEKYLPIFKQEKKEDNTSLVIKSSDLKTSSKRRYLDRATE